MAFADLTKQLAQQAILSATSGPKEAPAAAPAPVVNTGGVFLGQIQAMQKAVKEDEELLLTLSNGGEKIRVLEIFLPSPQVAVLGGIDANRQPVRVVSAVNALQLLCKVVKAPAGTKPVRIALVTSKVKDSSG